MPDVLMALALGVGVSFVAELGDKSQLMAMTLATRHTARMVLLCVGLAAAAVQGLSVAVGLSIGSALPAGWISLVAAVTFVGFGIWTLRDTHARGDEDSAVAKLSSRATVIAIFTAFFLAELGDRTMVASITPAAQYHGFGVWVGSTLGMVLADALAIAVGAKLGKRLPQRAISYGSAAVFVGFGSWLAVRGLHWLAPSLPLAVTITVVCSAGVALGTAFAIVARVRAVGRKQPHLALSRYHRPAAAPTARPRGRALPSSTIDCEEPSRERY